MRSRVARRGFTLIELVVVLAILGLLTALLLPAVQSAREAGRRLQCQDNLKQLALAASNYLASVGVYPFGVGGGGPPGEGRVPRWSAHSQLLICLELRSLYDAINFSGVAWLSDPVYGPANATAISTRVAGFLCPSDPGAIADGFGMANASYRACAGTLPYNLADDSPDRTGRNDGVFWFQSAVGPSSIRDGLSQTALFSERALGGGYWSDPKADYYLSGPAVATCAGVVPGTTPRYGVAHELSGGRWGDGGLFYTRYNHAFPPNRPACLLGGVTDYDCPVVVPASSRHPGGVDVALADGSVRFVREQVEPRAWAALATAAGGEVHSGDGD